MLNAAIQHRYVSVLVGAHASVKFRGVTIIEEHKENNGEANAYHEGSIQLRGACVRSAIVFYFVLCGVYMITLEYIYDYPGV